MGRQARCSDINVLTSTNLEPRSSALVNSFLRSKTLERPGAEMSVMLPPLPDTIDPNGFTASAPLRVTQMPLARTICLARSMSRTKAKCKSSISASQSQPGSAFSQPEVQPPVVDRISHVGCSQRSVECMRTTGIASYLPLRGACLRDGSLSLSLPASQCTTLFRPHGCYG